MKKIKRKRPKFKRFIMRVDPRVEDAVDQALGMVEQGKIQAAEKIISELLKQHPDIHTVQYAMGVICVMRGRYDEAISYFDTAIEIYPYFVEAWFNKGASHQKKLEIGEMIKSYQKVVEIGDPSDDFVRQANDVIKEMKNKIRQEKDLTMDQYLKGMDKFNKAFAAMQSQEWEKALKGFQDVVRIDPKHTQSYGNIGICYAHLSQRDEALEALDKALELDSDYEPAILNRAPDLYPLHLRRYTGVFSLSLPGKVVLSLQPLSLVFLRGDIGFNLFLIELR
ncbi:MAG: tetratricopeptide repeat protein [Nitrospirota bacterium]